MEKILEFDEWLLLKVNGCFTELLDPMMKMFSGRTVWILLYVAIAGVIFWKYGWMRGLLLVAATGISVGASDFICASVIRPLVCRMRPTNPDNALSALVHVVDGYRSGAYGFPSCHAANTFALAVITSLLIHSWSYTAFIYFWAGAQCYSRMYLGVHYPGDLLVGALIGAAIAYGVYALASKVIDMKHDLNEKAKAMPAVVVGIALCVYIGAVCYCRTQGWL